MIKKESIETIIESNQKGASAKAAANQAIYALLSSEPSSVPDALRLFLTQLKAIKKATGSPLSDESLMKAIFVLDDAIQNGLQYEQLKEEYGISNSMQLPLQEGGLTQQDFPHLMQLLFSELRAEAFTLELLQRDVQEAEKKANRFKRKFKTILDKVIKI